MTHRVGDRVHQHTYGLGEIVEANRDRVTIQFDDGSTRKFAVAIVHLEASAIPRPPSAKATRHGARKPGAQALR